MSYRVSACIVTYNESDKIYDCIASILANTRGLSFKLFVVDNCSTDNTVEIITRSFPQVSVFSNDKNLGFGAAHNLVLDLLDSDYHFVINPDIIMNTDTIQQLCDYLQGHDDTVMITPKILYKNGDEQFLPKRRPKIKYLLGGRIPFLSKYRKEYTRQDELFSQPADIDFCTGCFFAIRTECFINLNGFDPNFFMFFEDADLTLRAKQFGRVVFYPHCTVTHLWERASAKSIKYLMIHICSMLKFFIKYLNK